MTWDDVRGSFRAIAKLPRVTVTSSSVTTWAVAPPERERRSRPDRGPPEQPLGLPRPLPWPAHQRHESVRQTPSPRIFSTRATRLGTLHELTKLAPVAIVAEALGYSPETIETHATAPAADYARYVGAILDRRK